MRAVVYATAGHIDHGKTSLVAALTGVWCDRLREERERGITLVLGFAPLFHPQGEVEVSFVDVPGHERLVHTMLAGAGAVDHALLVVAADEGIMPQTREHLAILQLLGIRGGLVALTKADKVTPEMLQRRRHELESFLRLGPLAGAPIVPCSAITGEGIEALRQAIWQQARAFQRPTQPHRPFRLAADRVFSLPGTGTVVTGTARWGEVRVGQLLWAYPPGKTFRLRSLQVHGQERTRAVAGERVALALAGAKVEDIPRGAQLLEEGPWQPSQRLLVELSVLPDARGLEEGQSLWLSLLAARVLCRIERLHPEPAAPGGRVRAILRLAQPLFAAPGDRVVLRQPSPPMTLAGGPVVDAHPPRLPRREAARLAGWPDPAEQLAQALLFWLDKAGPAGLTLPQLAARLGLRPQGLEAVLGQLSAQRKVELVPDREVHVLARQQVAQALEQAKQLLQQAGQTGLTSPQLLGRVGVEATPALRRFYLGQLKLSGAAREEGGRLVAAGEEPLEDPLAQELEDVYQRAGWAAPSPQEVARMLQAHPKRVEALLALLLRRGRLVRVGGKWWLHRQLLDQLVGSLRSWGQESFSVGEFKERFGLTRKLAIPVLEWLDSQRVTRRLGERRRILPSAGGTSSSDPPADPRP